jgi:uncharacterized protein (TIGR03083 family)
MFDNLQAIRAESSRFTATLVGADLDRPVPSCPDWSLGELVEHLGTVQRFWADNVRSGFLDQPTRVRHSPPDSADGLVAWMEESTDVLIAALEDVPDDAPCWTWWGEPRTCGAVGRHQVQEGAVHRWDAEAALGTPAPIEPTVADDGVGEFLEIVIGSAANTLLGSLTLMSDDTDGEWIVGDQRGPSTVVRASASDLVLLLYGRLVPSDVVVEGDTVLIEDLLRTGETD